MLYPTVSCPDRRGGGGPDQELARTSPLLHAHLNPFGQYRSIWSGCGEPNPGFPANAVVSSIAMLAKGQVRAVPTGDMPAQRAFVQQIFGLAA